MDNAFAGYKPPVRKKLAAYYWQDAAAKVCKSLRVPADKRSIIFKAFGRDQQKAITAYKQMVGKTYKEPWSYFLKLVNL